LICGAAGGIIEVSAAPFLFKKTFHSFEFFSYTRINHKRIS
jgi:hypothetical protein